jgi:hypothetical protein
MLTFFLIVLFAFFKAISDTIKPDQFSNSIWSKWVDNKWIDTRISMSKDLNKPWYVYMWLIHFKDPWHLCNSIQYTLFFIAILTFKIPDYLIDIQYIKMVLFFIYWIWFGFYFELFRDFFKQYRL